MQFSTSCRKRIGQAFIVGGLQRAVPSAGIDADGPDLDAMADAIAVAPIPETGLGEAINDRLRRAAAPRD